jgi:hypothetical protein
MIERAARTVESSSYGRPWQDFGLVSGHTNAIRASSSDGVVSSLAEMETLVHTKSKSIVKAEYFI